MSEDDIHAGARWNLEVAKELEACNFGILCITRENVDKQWILFEAGALAKSLQESRLVPLLLDLDLGDISGPLAQFQAKKVDKSGLYEVIQSINQGHPQVVPEETAKTLFEALWTTKYEARIKQVPASAQDAKHKRAQSEVLEELVGAVRSMEGRLREDSDEPAFRPKRRHRMKFDPFLMHEIPLILSEHMGNRLSMSLLVIASVFRDEVPLLYELTMEAYRHSISGSPEMRRSLTMLLRTIDIFESGKFPPEVLGIDPMYVRIAMREIGHLLPPEPPEKTLKVKKRE
jgi:hypothetical protein